MMTRDNQCVLLELNNSPSFNIQSEYDGVFEDSPIDEHIKLPTFVDAMLLMNKVERDSLKAFSRWTKFWPDPRHLSEVVPNLLDAWDIWSAAITEIDYCN